jgi:hypothetical protein
MWLPRLAAGDFPQTTQEQVEAARRSRPARRRPLYAVGEDVVFTLILGKDPTMGNLLACLGLFLGPGDALAFPLDEALEVGEG